MNYTIEEFKNRLCSVRRKMEEGGLEAAVLVKTDDVLYLSGFDAGTGSTSCALILAGGEEPVLLVTPAWEAQRVKASTWIGKVHGVSGIAYGLNELHGGLAKGRVGLDNMNGLACEAADELAAVYDPWPFVDFGRPMLQVREVKTPAEIERIRESAKLCDALSEVFFDILRPGIWEADIHAELIYALHKLGGTRMHISMTTGFPNYWMHYMPYPRKLKNGDLIFCEIAPQYKDQWTEAVRMAVVGKVTREYRDLFAIELDATKRLIDALVPGAVSSEIYKGTIELARQSGIAMMETVDTMVHGAGLTLGDLPNIRYDSADVIREGQSLCVHAIFLFPYIATEFMLGEHVIINNKGAELVTKMQTELVAV